MSSALLLSPPIGYRHEFAWPNVVQVESLRPQRRRAVESTASDLVEAQGRRALVELASVSGLSENWDGYGAAGISCTVSRNANRVLRRAIEKGLVPDLSPTPAGTIEFDWEHGSFAASIEIGEGMLSLLAYSEQKLIRTGYVAASDLDALSGFWDLLSRELTASRVKDYVVGFLPKRYERNESSY